MVILRVPSVNFSGIGGRHFHDLFKFMVEMGNISEPRFVGYLNNTEV